MKIHTLQQAEAALLAYVPLVAQYGADGMSLDRLWPLLALVNNPHQKLKVVHIAGTSGKTSTAYYMAALLLASSKKVGLTVSPHVDSINERVQINGTPLEEVTFCKYLSEFLTQIAHTTLTPSYFELMIVFALWVFVQENVDYAVLETGMGGLLDGSNVVTRADKVCILTEIGYDHQHVLGSTLPEIAAQKAGIMHTGNVAFTYQKSVEITDTFTARAQAVGASLNILHEEDLHKTAPLVLKDLPLFQQHNWLLARYVANYIYERDNLTVNKADILATLHTLVPARMQPVQATPELLVIMDGAHNQQKMNALVISFKEKYGNKKVPVLLALKKGKDYGEVLDELLPLASSIIFTTFKTSQDMPAVSMDPIKLAEYCKKHNFHDYEIITSCKAAYKKLLTNKKIALATGSFYLLSQIRAS